MAANDNTSTRSLTVLAVVVTCFAVLWPKIFYPMIQSIIFPPDEEDMQDAVKKFNFDDMLHPQMRESMGEARPIEKSSKDANRGLFHPYIRQAAKPQSKGAGAVNFVIPVYTIGIILFFLYSLLKMFFKRYEEVYVGDKTSGSVCQNSFCVHKHLEAEEQSGPRKEIPPERKAQRALEQYGKDKVLIALKTIILEMEDIKGNFNELDINCEESVESADYFMNCKECEDL